MSKTTRQWYLTAEKRPPNGATVDTISPGGIEQRMEYRNNMWWADGHYVYYTPERWSPVEGGCR